MYKLLIVDDEVHAVQGIKLGVQWTSLGIDEVFTAYNIRQAKVVFSNHPIDVMVCDIEMPQGSGLELVDWINKNISQVRSIFLTCHADFQYAREALHLGSLDYLLKPVDFDELKVAVAKALNLVEIEREKSIRIETSQRYFKLWSMHQPLLIERFWRNLLDRQIPPETESIRKSMAEAEIAYPPDLLFIPVLIIVQYWQIRSESEEDRFREQSVLWNAAINLLVKDDKYSQILLMRTSQICAIFSTQETEHRSKEQLKQKCHDFREFCLHNIGCDLACYIGLWVSIEQVPDQYNKLQSLARNYVTSRRIVFADDHVILQKPASPSLLIGWHELLSQGNKKKWLAEVEKVFATLYRLEGFDAKFLREFYHEFLYVVYSVLKQKSIPVSQIFSLSEIPASEDKLPVGSILALHEWVKQTGGKIMDEILQFESNRSIVDKITLYIKQNIGQNLTRESIANEFFLNPDYLTRLFKKETGLSISEYLQQEKIKIAKDLLIHTELSVKDIVSRVGYSNFSYFSKVFRKLTRQNPRSFRKGNTE